MSVVQEKACSWWEVKQSEWSFTQPLKMPPLSDRIAVVLGNETKSETKIKNPQLQRLVTLLDSPKPGRTSTEILMETKPKEPAPEQSKRREPPKRVASKKENRLPPKKPERITSRKTMTTPPEIVSSQKPSPPRYDQTKNNTSARDLTPPAEPAPQAPMEQAPEAPKAPSPKVEISPSPTPKPQPQPTVQKAEATISKTETPAATENYPDMKFVLAKLKQLDDLMEDLELDFTEVMVSENWEPMRNIVRQLTSSFNKN